MKRRHRNKKRPMRVIRLWSRPEAEKVIPYLRSVVGSLREHWLDMQSADRDTARIARSPGRPDRARILADESARASKTVARDRFEDALSELSKLDIFLLDPVNGVALIPFGKDDDLAWFVYDQFDEQGLAGWRFHEDAMEQRRPLDQLDGPAKAAS